METFELSKTPTLDGKYVISHLCNPAKSAAQPQVWAEPGKAMGAVLPVHHF